MENKMKNKRTTINVSEVRELREAIDAVVIKVQEREKLKGNDIDFWDALDVAKKEYDDWVIKNKKGEKDE
tara:strand:+ start:390 stop:599 length:210 start_codon:yes stop_codon:yes gene_type:complete